MAVSAHFCSVLIFCAICLGVAERPHQNRPFTDTYSRRRHEFYCGEASFRCDSGQCIGEEKLCDGREDCRDGSDETRECVNIVPCASKFLFQCDYGACINKERVCDGSQDCKDNSDESPSACKSRCGKGSFRCNSGQCINQHLMCDGKADCSDSSDETNRICSDISCPSYTYRCKYGACVQRSGRCNGIEDCNDGSDELDCTAFIVTVATTTPTEAPTTPYRPPATSYTPPTTPYRPSEGYRCSGEQFMCNSGQCLTEGRICDGRVDCNDSSDESNGLCSQVHCASAYYQCAYGACVDKAARCNGTAECLDNSDENGCPSVERLVTPDQSSAGSCIMPVDPKNGIYTIGRDDQNVFRPFDVVPPYSVLVTNCNQGYSANPPDEIPSICLNGTWMPSPGGCSTPCPLIASTLSDTVECKYKNRLLKSCDNAVDGTVAIVPCAPLEDNPGIIQSLTHMCKNGQWDKPVSHCLSGQHADPNNTVVNVFYIFNRDNMSKDSS